MPKWCLKKADLQCVFAGNYFYCEGTTFLWVATKCHPSHHSAAFVLFYYLRHLWNLFTVFNYNFDHINQFCLYHKCSDFPNLDCVLLKNRCLLKHVAFQINPEHLTELYPWVLKKYVMSGNISYKLANHVLFCDLKHLLSTSVSASCRTNHCLSVLKNAFE